MAYQEESDNFFTSNLSFREEIESLNKVYFLNALFEKHGRWNHTNYNEQADEVCTSILAPISSNNILL
jgi:hypothetical protein